MSDREMVMQHFQDAIEASGNNNKWRFVRLDIIEKALALLKEQEPVKPIWINTNYEQSCKCGNCGGLVNTHFKYCPRCGRLVKWE